ncbi:MAG: hypothetical protein JO266_04485 [Acidobacteria bacterium]|nr:hypothetical protein [Acidobacteriota bacterium]
MKKFCVPCVLEYPDTENFCKLCGGWLPGLDHRGPQREPFTAEVFAGLVERERENIEQLLKWMAGKSAHDPSNEIVAILFLNDRAWRLRN